MSQWNVALRQLGRRRGFSSFAMALLAAGIAANSAIFGVADSILLKPLPYPDSKQLVFLLEKNSSRRDPESLIAPARLEDWRRMNHTFSAIAGYYWDTKTDLSGSAPERLDAFGVTPGYFAVYQVKPRLGRTFNHSEETFGGPNAVVLSDGFWQRRFAGSRSVLGKQLRLGLASYTIVGVMPPHFVRPDIDIWYSYPPPPFMAQVRDARFLSAVGRVKAGITIAQASDDLTRVQNELAREYPKTDKGWGVQITSLKREIVGDHGESVWIAFAAVGTFLLLACANIAALLLAQAQQRTHEMAIRASLGATRWQISGTMLREVVLICGVAAVLGGLCSAWLIDGIRHLATSLPRISEVQLDPATLVFVIGISTTAAIFAGAGPALYSSRNIRASLLSGGRTQAGPRRSGQTALVVAQVSITVGLLTTAGLLLRSYGQLSTMHPGFSADHVLTFHISAEWSEDRNAIGLLQRNLVQALQDSPGVSAAGAANFFPAENASLRYQYQINGISSGHREQTVTAGSRMITGGYVSALQVPILKGRNCPALPMNMQQQGETVLNRAFADQFAPGQDLVGHTLSILGAGVDTQFRIIGVVGDMREDTLRTPPSPYVYTCMMAGGFPDVAYVLRAHGDPAGYAEIVRDIVHRLAPARAVFDVGTLDEHISADLEQPRLTAGVLTGFALAALLLAASGLYSLCNLTVISRTREIGTRVALGARGSQVVRDILAGALRTLLAGLALGILLATVAGFLVRSLLFGVTAYDPLTLVAVCCVLLMAACVAMLIPALRAANIDPVQAMRQE